MTAVLTDCVKKPLSSDCLLLFQGVYMNIVRARVLKYYVALLGTVVLWGTSFPVIKVLVSNVNEYTYVWVRGFFSALSLTPVILFLVIRKGLPRNCFRGGLLAGFFYCLGLFFSGVGNLIYNGQQFGFYHRAKCIVRSLDCCTCI